MEQEEQTGVRIKCLCVILMVRIEAVAVQTSNTRVCCKEEKEETRGGGGRAR